MKQLSHQLFIQRTYSTLAALVILVSLCVAFFSLIQKSPTIDEGVHLGAGLTYWDTGDFRLNPEHPPLIKEIAAIPLLLFLDVDPKTNGEFFQQATMWEFGDDFLINNTEPTQTMVIYGRTILLVFFALLGILVYRWARRLYDQRTALVILVFTMISPVLLAHARLITTDLGVTLAFLFASFTLARYIEKPNKKTFLWFAFAMSFGFLIKFSFIFFIFIALATLLVYSIIRQDSEVGHGQREKEAFIFFFKKGFFPLVLAGIITVGVIFLAYGFNFQRAYEVEDTRVEFEQLLDVYGWKENSKIQWIGENFYFPAYYYWEGFFRVFAHNQGGHTSVFYGQVDNRGNWDYFPTLFLLKSSPVTLLLFVGVVASLCFFFIRPLIQSQSGRLRAFLKHIRSLHFDKLILVIAPLVFFVFSMRSNLNLGVRHVLMIYPFIFLLSGIFIQPLLKHWGGKIFIAILLGFATWTTAIAFPHYISYWNPAIDDVDNAKYIAADSNLDWGQDLLFVKDYIDRNGIEKPYMFYFGRRAGAMFETKTPPTIEEIKSGAKPSGYAFVSAGVLADPPDEWTWILTKQPIERIGGSIYVYYF